MKKKLFLSLTLIVENCFAQRRNDRLYEVIGLPEGDEIVDSLKIAFPLIIVGFLIAYFFMWSKKDSEKWKAPQQILVVLG